MSQVSLYLEDQSMALLRSKAGELGMSLSKYVAGILQQSMEGKHEGWPAGYWESVYGCLDCNDMRLDSDSCLDSSLDDDCNWFEGV